MGKKKKTTNHYHNHRYKREEFIDNHMNGDGIAVDYFVVDRGHKDGVEIHTLTDNGIIIIHNWDSGLLITKLIARPQQIKRYYEKSKKTPPPEYESILALARWHNSLNYNK